MVSPGYSYDKAPDQSHFAGRDRSISLFRKVLSNRDPKWQFNMSPLFLEFLMGHRNFECTPWGMPAYSIFGWQKPCYLQQDGYTDTYAELLESTDWSKYGFESGNPKCSNCMLHSGYEASAVDYTFSLKGIFATVKAMLNTRYEDPEVARQLAQEKHVSPLVQIDLSAPIAKSETLQGRTGKDAQTVEDAFDYRGDVTVTLKDGSQLEGYIFDRGAARLRMMLRSDGKKVTLQHSEIEELAFTGRDMADGRSFEAWIRKYAERKAAGDQNIELVPEALD